jgi:oligopeptidase A
MTQTTQNDSLAKNPLLEQFDLPPFSAIRPEHIVPAVKAAIDACRAAIEQVVAQSGPKTNSAVSGRPLGT